MKYLMIAALLVLVSACGKKEEKKADAMAGMDMGHKHSADAVELNEQQMVLGNIQVDTIRNGVISDRTILTATLNVDQTKINTISSRVMGRIERLYFKNPGDFVRKGDKVMDIYSEVLNNAKQEYLLALEKRDKIQNPLIDFTAVVQSAKTKLLLWGVTEAQIKELERTKNTSVLTAFYSPYFGYVTSIENREGEYTPEGGKVIKMANLSTLWAEAQVYTSQMAGISSINTALVQFPDIPGLSLHGRIEFVNPEITQQTRLNLLRVTIPNPGNRLKPGMPAYVYIKARESNSLTLPSDAVIRNANSAVVWVQTAHRVYESRMVQLGLQEGNRVQITSGLKNGDVVVTSGAYLVNSEYTFKKGGNAMEGMKM